MCGGVPAGVGFWCAKYRGLIQPYHILQILVCVAVWWCWFPERPIARLNLTGSYFTDSGVCGGVPACAGIRCALQCGGEALVLQRRRQQEALLFPRGQ